MKRIWLYGLLLLLPLGFMIVTRGSVSTVAGNGAQTTSSPKTAAHAPKSQVSARPVAKKPTFSGPVIRVMTLGSSVAKGWGDVKGGGGYLIRGFKTVSQKSGIQYEVFNKATPGASATQIAGYYPVWLRTIHPQIVVISWGMLDDCHDKTPIGKFDLAIYNQVQEALAAHALVFMVSPPVTRASYTQYKVSEPFYLHAEESVATHFHSPNVYVFHVFSQMKAYIAAHHQTYVPYMSDGWHPNARGHELAGQLMAQDIYHQFGKTLPTFKS